MLKPNSKFKIQIDKFRHNLSVFVLIIPQNLKDKNGTIYKGAKAKAK